MIEFGMVAYGCGYAFCRKSADLDRLPTIANRLQADGRETAGWQRIGGRQRMDCTLSLKMAIE